MRKAIFLALPAALILCTNYSTFAQLGTALVLVKGDAPNSSTPTCSFTSATILSPIPVVQGLLGVQRGDPPEQVEAAMGFPPDQPYTKETLQWTGERGGNYVQAVVNFRNNTVATRSFTMAINYKQSNEKQCRWEVQEAAQGTQQGTQQLTQPLTP